MPPNQRELFHRFGNHKNRDIPARPPGFQLQVTMKISTILFCTISLCFCKGDLTKLEDNPGINILDLGQVHVYKHSYYSYFFYDMRSLELEYGKIIEFRDNLTTKINNAGDDHKNSTSNDMNILDFNIMRLERKMDHLFRHKRSKRGLIDGLGSVLKAITGNLDATDGEKYDTLFKQIKDNQQILQEQNMENIRINREMISKFNKQIENLHHNDLELGSRIEVLIRQQINWYNSVQMDKIIRQVIFLSSNLNQILDEVETSLTFCNLHQIHSSIITNEELYKVIEGDNRNLSFWELTVQITSHCKINDNIIEYLLEIPKYHIDENNKLLQITPIPNVNDGKMFFINQEKKLLISNQEKLFEAHDCNRIKNKYYCKSNFVETKGCIKNIVLNHNNEQCEYYKINDAFLVMEIENKNLAIIASTINKYVEIGCDNAVKHTNIKGVYRFITSSGCRIGNYNFEKKITRAREIEFANIKFDIKEIQVSNTTLDLKQIEKAEISVNALSKIKDITTDEHYLGYVNSTLLIILIIIITAVYIIYRRKKAITIKLQNRTEHDSHELRELQTVRSDR